MAGETGTSVGVITLDLRILNTLQQQLEGIAAKAQQSAQQSFAKVGDTAGKAMQAPVQKAGETIEKAITAPVEKAQKVVENTLKKTQDDTDAVMKQINDVIAEQQRQAQKKLQEKVSLPTSVPLYPNGSATATTIRKQQGKDIDTSGHAANAPPDLSDTFKPATDAAELLRQKLFNIQMQFDAEREKLAQLNAEFTKLQVGTAAWDELSAKITASESRLISFQSTMNATQAKIDEPARKAAAAAEKAAESQKRSQEKAAAAAERAAQRAAQAQERAAQRAAQASQRAAAQVAAANEKTSSRSSSAFSSMGNGIGNVAGRLGRSVGSALKSTFLMAGLYAAFKGMRSLMGDAATQNKQFAASLNAVKANLAVAFTPIIQAVMPALNALMSGLATVTQAIATFISAIFGKTYAQSLAATKQMQKTAAAAKKSASGSGRSVAGFEEIHVIQKQDSGSDSAGGVNFDALGNKGNATAEKLAVKFKAAWAGIASGFNDYVIKPIQANLSKFDAPVTRFKALFADIGQQGIQWLKPLSIWFQTDFKNALNISITNTMAILAGLADSASIVAATIWNAWKPVINWFVTQGLPILTDAWVECSNTGVTAFEAVKTVFDTLWHDVMEPFYQFASQVILDILNTFKTLWNQYGATTFNNIRTTINTIRDTALNVWKSFLKPIFDQLFQTIKELWTSHLQPLVYQISVFVAKLVNGAMEIYNGFIAPLVNWFIRMFGPQIAGTVNGVIRGVGSLVGSILDAARYIFQAFGGVIDFLTGVFTGNWSRALNGLKSIFTGVFGALYSIAKTPLNALIGLLNGTIGGINLLLSGLNKIRFSIPDWVPSIGGKSFGINIPRIPSVSYLAKGGIVDQPTLSMIGEAGREAVVPLENNTSGLQELANKLIAMGGVGGSVDYQRLYDTIVRALRDSQLGVTLYNINYEQLAKGMMKIFKEYYGSKNIPQTT